MKQSVCGPGKKRLIIACSRGTEVRRLAWLSYQPKDHAISFGLYDTSAFTKTPDGTVLADPHITYHPRNIELHITANGKLAAPNMPFIGLMDMGMMVDLAPHKTFPWIDSVTGPVSDLPTDTRQMTDTSAVEHLIYQQPMSFASARVRVWFCSPAKPIPSRCSWLVPSPRRYSNARFHAVAVSWDVDFVPPRGAELNGCWHG